LAYDLQIDNTSLPLRFLLVTSADHITGATGKTPTVTIAKADGLGFVTPSGAVTEIGNGWYSLAANATDASVLGPLLLHATASACDPSDEEYVVVNYNPTATAIQATPDSTTVTVTQLVTTALRRIKVVAAGMVASSDDLQDSWQRLNELIDVMALQPLMIYSQTRSTFTISSSKGILGTPYTIGPSGDVNIVRPLWIEDVRFQDTSVSPTLERPLWKLTPQAYRTIPMKGLTSVYPNSWYYEPTAPTGSLYLWMVPTSTTLQGVLYALTAVARFGAITDLVALPPGYLGYLRDALALELWPEYRDGPPDVSLVKSVMEKKALIKAANLRMSDLAIDPALIRRRGGYSIYQDGL
jgi:hypothetical protein